MASVVLICALVRFFAAFPLLHLMFPVSSRAERSTSAPRAKFEILSTRIRADAVFSIVEAVSAL